MEETVSNDSSPRHAVLLLHGLCGTPVELGSIPKALKQLSYTVSTLEIQGYSATQITAGQTPDWEIWCDTVHTEITRLNETHETVSLCGLSMGAALALAVATQRSDILAVVALSPMLRYDGWAIPWYMPLLKLVFLLGFRNWSYKEKEPFGIRNIEMRRRVAKALEKDGVAEVGAAAIPARQLHAAQKMMAQVRSSLAQVRSDLLLVHAVDDETTAPRNSEQILKDVQSETRKAIWLGDCYHIITFDNEREIVTNEAARFIQQAINTRTNDESYRRLAGRSALRHRREPITSVQR